MSETAKRWKIYFDACCLNRPFDDQTQDRIRLETEAILLIMAHLYAGEWQWIGSSVLTFEIEQTPDPVRRFRVLSLLGAIHRYVSLEPTDVARGKQLEALGFKPFDALHLACAERSGADVFLTTDDKLLRRATAHRTHLHVPVANPLSWFQKVSFDETEHHDVEPDSTDRH